jgi:single-strand DNA-binding protein
MTNEAFFSVCGFVATQPWRASTKAGDPMLSMRIGWTPRLFDRGTGAWKDQPSSFANVTCFRKVAENAATCLRKGDPIVVKGTLRIREFADQSGARRTAIDIVADSIGHDLARGVSSFIRTRPPTGFTALEAEAEEAERAASQPSADALADAPADDPQAEALAEEVAEEMLGEDELDAIAAADEDLPALA